MGEGDCGGNEQEGGGGTGGDDGGSAAELHRRTPGGRRRKTKRATECFGHISDRIGVEARPRLPTTSRCR
jgi:hypothetical protein